MRASPFLSTGIKTADLAHDDRITLAGITVEGDGIGRALRDMLYGEARRVFNEYGPAAFDCSKISAAIHEAGHVVAHVALGGRVRRTRIKRHAPDAWIGYTEYRGGLWNISPRNETACQWLQMSRDLYAGVAAEMLFDDDFRHGSSLDEVVMSQWAGGMAAAIEGQEPSEFWNTRVNSHLSAIFEQHRQAHRSITDRLATFTRLTGRALDELCALIANCSAATAPA